MATLWEQYNNLRQQYAGACRRLTEANAEIQRSEQTIRNQQREINWLKQRIHELSVKDVDP